MSYRLVSPRSVLPLYLPSRLPLGLQSRNSWTFRPTSFCNPYINIMIGTSFCSTARSSSRCNASSSRSGLPCSDVSSRIWIDTDAGVDDALAIALALSHPTVHVVGISVVRGNVDVAQGLVNVGRVLLTAAKATPLNINLGAAPDAGAGGCRRDASAKEGIVQAAPDPPSSQPPEQPSPLPRACQPHAQILPGATSSGVLPAPAFTFHDVPVYGGADAPLASPPQSLTYYYGRDGLGDVPYLEPAESWVRLTLFGGGGPKLAGNMSTSRIAVNRNSDGSGDAGDFHDVDTDLIDGSAQPISNAAPAAVAAPAAEAEAATSGVGGVIMELSAAEALVAAARGSPGQLVVVALGPLTNLALALRIEPQLPSLLRALLVLGGGEGEYGGNVTPYAEFNFHADPEAAAEVVRGFGDAASNCRRSHSSNGASCFPGVKGPGGEPRIALVTWYCCQQNLLHWDVVDELMAVAGGDVALADPAAAGIAEGAAASHSPSQRGSFMKGILAPFLTRWRGDSPNGMLLGDPLAVAVAMGLQPTGAKKAQLVTSTPGCGQLSQLHQQGYAVKSADFGAGPIQPPWEQQGTSLSGGLVLNPPASDQWGGLVLDYYVAPCRVELQGERRGACVYGCSHVQHDTIVTKADMMKDARCVLHVNDKGPDGLNGAEASPNAEMRLVTVIRSIHIPTVAEMLRRVLS